MYEFFAELRKREDDGSVTVLRRERLRPELVIRGFAEWVRKRRRSKKLRSSPRAVGRPGRSDVTKALLLSQQGVSRREIYTRLGIPPVARRAFCQALWRRKRRQERKARKDDKL